MRGKVTIVKAIRIVVSLFLLLGLASPAAAQFGLIEQGAKRAKQISDFSWSNEEKAALGAKVSELVRQRYGVVQDAAVHKYVTLVGRTVTDKTTKPGLPWTFIVLDTDAVNAFAAPHGYVHITRGALALMKDESELAGVLAHEIVHVAECGPDPVHMQIGVTWPQAPREYHALELMLPSVRLVLRR